MWGRGGNRPGNRARRDAVFVPIDGSGLHRGGGSVSAGGYGRRQPRVQPSAVVQWIRDAFHLARHRDTFKPFGVKRHGIDPGYPQLSADYSDDHPELGGLYLSHNTVLLVFGVGTTVEQANGVLLPLGGQLVGSIPGVAGESPSILIVKLPTTTHQELETALGTLRASSLVVEAVQDVLLGPHATPPSKGAHPISWSWNSSGPGGDTDNLKLVRAPQMWNLNGALRKAHRGTLTGILDVGFGNHPDVSFVTQGPASVGFHGLAVAGIVAAKYGNDLGIEGINPFSDSDYSSGGLIVSSLPVLIGGGGGTHLMESLGALMVSGLRGLRLARPELRVINISLGYNWIENGVDPNTQAARAVANRHGRAVAQIPQGLGASPLIVVSAGNDLAHFSQSNVGGHIMAPGLAGHMLTADPNLWRAEVKLILYNNGTHGGLGGTRGIDAWASVMGIDGYRGNDAVLRMMVDIDDGTPDGGQFVNFEEDPSAPEFTNNSLDADGEGGIGDGEIDMCDFRRWRDWYHHIWNYGAHSLEGTEDHAKMDVNGNGATEDGQAESKLLGLRSRYAGALPGPAHQPSIALGQCGDPVREGRGPGRGHPYSGPIPNR